MLKIDINLLFTVINLLILYALLRHFLFKPLQQTLAKRRRIVEDDFAQAKMAREAAEDLKTQYETSMENAKEESAKLMAETRAKAEAMAADKMAEAQREADALMAKARRQLAEERAQTEREVQDAIADLAMQAARKALESGEVPTEVCHGEIR
ncbi:ATP synthase F0 subunit B [Pseudoramibacter faecis]|uniref:ATP synthase F0 subunit B n=1 Tax=Pseudoramibacter faecis TaxID=3108534 RepID=UPI002E78067A|nr:ATP synthase F0 subunit B [Pseudoramibacter sp. HA2172]